MEQLFENDHLQIESNPRINILEIKNKQVCDDLNLLEDYLTIIDYYVKNTHAKKIVLCLDTFDQFPKESLLSEKFFPRIGEDGVTDIAIITGENKKVQTFISELGLYLAPIREQYHITSETFETYQQAIQWITER